MGMTADVHAATEAALELGDRYSDRQLLLILLAQLFVLQREVSDARHVLTAVRTPAALDDEAMALLRILAARRTAKRAESTYRMRSCAVCAQEYRPTGSTQRYCRACVPARRRPED